MNVMGVKSVPSEDAREIPHALRVAAQEYRTSAAKLRDACLDAAAKGVQGARQFTDVRTFVERHLLMADDFDARAARCDALAEALDENDGLFYRPGEVVDP